MAGNKYTSQEIPEIVLAIYKDGSVNFYHADDRLDFEERDGVVVYREKGSANIACSIGSLRDKQKCPPPGEVVLYSVYIDPPPRPKT